MRLDRCDSTDQSDESSDRATDPSDEPDDVNDQHSGPDEPSEADAPSQPSNPTDADAMPEPESDGEPEPDDHRSLSMKMPSEFNAKAARPRVVLHFHLSEAALRSGHAIVRPEDGGPLTLNQLIDFLSRSGCQVRIQPVLDPTEVAPVDGYDLTWLN